RIKPCATTSKRLARLARHGPSLPSRYRGRLHFVGTVRGGSMLSVYVPNGPCLERSEVPPTGKLPENGIWFDLVTPTIAEDKLLERHLGIAVPTREEMLEIEVTSRLYVENGARYMTATMMCQSDTETPKTTAVTFILSGHRLVTVRYDDPKPFMIVGNK